MSSHRGWDPGAYDVSKYLARHLEAPLFFQKISRLLIDVNRSVGSNELFSEFTQNADASMKDQLMHKYYDTFRKSVEKKLQRYIEGGDAVLHISVHSFTPVLNNVVRVVDIGILFDESRDEELKFSQWWKEKLENVLPEKLIMLNCPYHGADDGFTTYLRSRFPDEQYLGIEVEINQKYVNTEEMKEIKTALVHSITAFDHQSL